jgi:hypothetical protein
MSNTRGRPRKTTHRIEIPDIRCEHIVTKEDSYENKISYFKVVDSGFKHKLKPILEHQVEDCKLPLWKTDDGLYMLKCKTKFMPKREFDQNELIIATLIFKQYCFTTDDDKLLQGYYLQVQTNDNTEFDN